MNPIIVALDRKGCELFRAPLSDIRGMAYGVKEDFASGKIVLAGSWCPTDNRVCFWSVAS